MSTSPRESHDVIVVGGGPAGLSAALMLGRQRRHTLVCDTDTPANAVSHAVHGMLGFDGVPPRELRATARAQCERYPSLDFQQAEVRAVDPADGAFRLTLADQRELRARKVILACGRRYELPEIPAADEVRIARADYFTSLGGQFLSVEAKSSDAEAATLTVRWDSGPGTPMGTGGSATLRPFVDADAYQYHRRQVAVNVRPSRIEVTSSSGGSATDDVREWLPPDDDDPGGGPYFKDFIDHYMDPTELQERIKSLAAEFPRLAEIVTLPNKTNGYRRKAQALLGSADTPAEQASAVVVTSRAWGHEGGSDLTVQLRRPSRPDQELAVSSEGNNIEVSLATDATGEVTSTAAQVSAALNDEEGNRIVAHPFRDTGGTGVVRPQFRTRLDDFLSAPSNISREPFQPLAIRIGRHRDGSRTGVMAYAQEHAREWVPPLVAVETAERLLRNYATDRRTRKLLNNLDVFIIPSVNTDGGHYSFYDYNFQRKTMFNYCPPRLGDPLLRENWGVDTNRNYAIGSLFDGYSGASTTCTSNGFAGPFELSEPEARNVVAVADANPNIRFSMNLHSFGNYFMWSPGAYKVPGRETLPRPSLGEEAFFWGASSKILTEIKKHRGLSVTPARTGPIADVLYSAAGNSGDHLWYANRIFAWNFEVGDAGFQPAWEEAHDQAMEFANGLVGLMDVALRFRKDKRPPRSGLVPRPSRYDGPVDVRFETSEPATVFYTTNGRRPTFDSKRYEAAGIREGGEKIRVDRTTVFRWFSVDAAGNIERGYDPNGSGAGYREGTYRIAGR